MTCGDRSLNDGKRGLSGAERGGFDLEPFALGTPECEKIQILD